MKKIVSFFRPLFNTDRYLAFVLLLFTGTAVCLYRNFIPDDTFIHIAYARDIFNGKGFSFAGNATYGSTSPLWPLFIGTISYTGAGMELSAKISSLVFALGAIVLFYNIVSMKFGRYTALCSVLLMSFNLYFLRWAFTGMEASAACFFTILLIYMFPNINKNGVNIPLFFLAGFAPLIRPEFYVFIPVLYIFLYLSSPSGISWSAVFVSALPALAWNCFAFVYYGTVVPTTFMAKAGESFFSTDMETLMRTAKLILSSNPAEIFFILASAALLYKKKKIFNPDPEYIVIILWVLIFYGYYILKNVTILSRYSLVLLPAIILLTLYMIVTACDLNGCSVRMKRTVLSLLVSGALLLDGVLTYCVVKPDADSFAGGFDAEYRKIASILSDMKKDDESVAVSDVGIIGAYSGMRICDFIGLVDRDRFNYSGNREYFVAKKPDYLIGRGEVNIGEFKNTGSRFYKIYSAHIGGFGINKKGDVDVVLYKVEWINP